MRLVLQATMEVAMPITVSCTWLLVMRTCRKSAGGLWVMKMPPFLELEWFMVIVTRPDISVPRDTPSDKHLSDIFYFEAED